MKNNRAATYAALLILILFACSDEGVRLPKPHMYPKVSYPEKIFADFDTSLCNFTFRLPKYSTLVKDSFIFEGEPLHPCWFDINIPELNASIYCSYYSITKDKDLSGLINDAFNIAGKHNIKANYRKETITESSNEVKGILFDIEGPVASPVQFYLTDEKKHFFRGSLYFNSKVNPDSTAPILTFLKTDIDTLITSFRWK